MLAGRLAWVALIAVAACGRGGPDADSPHRRVACVGCHREGADSLSRSGVPDATCTSRGCHETGGPEQARLAMVTFGHVNHPDLHGGAATCASCHTHAPGRTTLKADATSCILCHKGEVTGPADTGCATCHPSPSHTRFASQGVALPHTRLLESGVPCTRCHYQLAEGNLRVGTAACVSCHRPGSGRSTVRETPLPADSAHATHRDLGCIACHERIVHRVVAMSTTVRLDCLDCHALTHRRPIPEDISPDSTCGDCHEGVHADEQRMVLGLLPGDTARPSHMFIGGVTCQSCHLPGDRPPPRPGVSLRGTPAACTGCHGRAWSGVLDRWKRGYARRDERVSAYIRSAQAALADTAVPPTARMRLQRAAALVSYLRRSGPLHNLPLTDRAMRQALGLVGDAYRVASVNPPPPPSLGPPVVSGNCMWCHYGVEEASLGRDSLTGRMATHSDHVFRGGLDCSACHAVGAPPPGFAGRDWIDSVRAPAREPRRP